MNKEDFKERTKDFTQGCVNLALTLPNTILERQLQGQLTRSCSSVAANYRAASIAHSKVSFTSKLSSVIEEVDESLFWLAFIIKENLLNSEILNALIKEAGALTAIFISSRKIIQENMKAEINDEL
ncbi:MAG: four helix bundle protein [Bacteroidales bacterium]|nr:four helix bundle protein [Bacteroidales bacterium]